MFNKYWQGGQWFIMLIDYYGGTFVAIIVGILEIATIFWMYGLLNFLNDVEFMLGNRLGAYWRACWLVITPVLMIIILIYTCATYEPLMYDSKRFPDYAYGQWNLFYFIILYIRFLKYLFYYKAHKIIKFHHKPYYLKVILEWYFYIFIFRNRMVRASSRYISHRMVDRPENNYE